MLRKGDIDSTDIESMFPSKGNLVLALIISIDDVSTHTFNSIRDGID